MRQEQPEELHVLHDFCLHMGLRECEMDMTRSVAGAEMF